MGDGDILPAIGEIGFDFVGRDPTKLESFELQLPLDSTLFQPSVAEDDDVVVELALEQAGEGDTVPTHRITIVNFLVPSRRWRVGALRRAVGSVSRLMDADFVPFELEAVEHRDRGLGVRGVLHVDEPIAVRGADASVRNPDVPDEPVSRKELPNGFFGSAIWKVAHVEFHRPAFEGLTVGSRRE
jgi:hypothetical protein